MVRLIQIIGWAFILLGIMLAGLMGIMVVGGPPLTEPGGAVWNTLHSSSLGLFQVFVQRILGLPDLWDNQVVPILLAPAWQSMTVIATLSFVIGAVLLAIARRQRRAGIIHRNHMS
jgi:hypothetical protein